MVRITVKRIPPQLEAGLCDMDGTLLNTEEPLYKSWVEMLRRYGKDFRTFRYPNIMGRTELRCCEIVVEHFALGVDPAAFMEEREVVVKDLFARDGVALMPGAAAFLGKMQAARIPLALVTSSTLEQVHRVMDGLGIFGRFDAHVTADTPGLTARKPDPAPYLLAAQMLGVNPKRCAVFEDTPIGLEAGRAAGCRTFGIPHQRSLKADLYRAHVLLHSLAEFDPDRALPEHWT